jgi:hypothetical protein
MSATEWTEAVHERSVVFHFPVGFVAVVAIPDGNGGVDDDDGAAAAGGRSGSSDRTSTPLSKGPSRRVHSASMPIPRSLRLSRSSKRASPPRCPAAPGPTADAGGATTDASRAGNPSSPLIISSPLTLTMSSGRRRYGWVCWMATRLHSPAGRVMSDDTACPPPPTGGGGGGRRGGSPPTFPCLPSLLLPDDDGAAAFF